MTEKEKLEEETASKLIKLNLDEELIVNSVKEAFESIHNIEVPETNKTMKDLKPSPQVMGNFLHELIPVFISKQDDNWEKGEEKNDKDLVNKVDDSLSIEIKTSSSKNNIYGNRSYGQEQSLKDGVKSKDGYYLAVNFEKYDKNSDKIPQITKIRIGYLEHGDWIPQKSESGQQARLSSDAEKFKLKTIYKKETKK